jgi:hypothetical protein
MLILHGDSDTLVQPHQVLAENAGIAAIGGNDSI